MRRRIKWKEYFEDYIENNQTFPINSISEYLNVFKEIYVMAKGTYYDMFENYTYLKDYLKLLDDGSLVGKAINDERLTQLTNRLFSVILDKYMSMEARSFLYKINGEKITYPYGDSGISKLIMFKYVDKWDKLFKAFTLDYNPIHNYDMIEQEKVGSKIVESSTGSSTSSQTLNDKESVNEDKTKTNNIGRDVSLTTTTDGNAEGKVIKSGSVEKQISAFNGGYANSEKEIYNNVTEENPYANNRSHESQTVSGSATDNKETSTERTITNANDNYRQLIGTHNDTSSKTESKTIQGSKDDNVRDLTRSGNIGVTTSQQMLESEIELRRFMIEEEMIKDCIETLTLKTY